MSEPRLNRKRLLASATLLFISVMATAPGPGACAGQGKGSAVETGEPVQGLKHDDGAGATQLPEGDGAWLIELTRSGGMLPVTETFSLNSAGELSLTRKRMTGGRVAVECSRKERLPARDLLKIKAAVLSAEPSAWKKDYEDPQSPICCDQPTTRVKLSRRGAKGRAQGYSTSWYPGSYETVATDLKALLTFIQPLWDAAHDRCTSNLRSGRR